MCSRYFEFLNSGKGTFWNSEFSFAFYVWLCSCDDNKRTNNRKAYSSQRNALTSVSEHLVKSFSSIKKRLSGEIKDCKDQVTDISASVYL